MRGIGEAKIWPGMTPIEPNEREQVEIGKLDLAVF